ncbi:hypothetical protein EK21DRAFT_118875 [Setomelanomma holmii]|uniref:BTB domain-containing protein n=1 Tax=Setomelanomma holmii TaxID=210430 RepID=A0A9P4GY78_9PLEO|nr:hypothetical protein EK21DRAFT_118875 [Setomelanomma holmii]
MVAPGPELGNSSRIELDFHAPEPQPLSLLVKFLYTGDYEPLILPDPADNLHYEYDPETLHTCEDDPCLHHPDMSQAQSYCQQCARVIAPTYPPYASCEDQVRLHLSMAIVGMNYHIDNLFRMAIDKFKRACERFWDTDAFEYVAEKIINNNSPTLKKVIVDVVSQHETLFTKQKFQQMLKTRPGFAYHVLIKYMEKKRR